MADELDDYDKILLGWRLFNQVSGILNKAR